MSSTTARSTPTLPARASASAATAICTPHSNWLIVLTTAPCPGRSPTCTTLPPTTSSTGPAAAKAAADAPTMMLSVPAVAPPTPAGNGRVDEMQPERLAPGREPLHRAGRAGGRDDDGATRRQRGGGAPVEQHGLDLGGVNDHQHERVRPGGGVGGGAHRLAAGARQRLERRRVQVEAAHDVAGAQQVERHRQPHGAEPDEADSTDCVCVCHFYSSDLMQ